MSTRTTIVLALIMIGIAFGVSLAVFTQLPEPVASHWNINDQVDGSMSRFWGAFLMPLITLGVLGLFLLIPVIDPMRANIATFRPSFNLFIVLMVVFLFYMHILTLLWNLGMQTFRISSAMLPALGLLFIFIGFMLKRARRNFSIGIRTPWTLSSDHVWDRTHHLGATLFMVSGVLAALGAFFPGNIAYWLVLGPVMASSLYLVVYSYVLWRQEQTG